VVGKSLPEKIHTGRVDRKEIQVKVVQARQQPGSIQLIEYREECSYEHKYLPEPELQGRLG